MARHCRFRRHSVIFNERDEDEREKDERQDGDETLIHGATLPTIQRKRGRPKGSKTSAIGLSKEKNWWDSLLQEEFKDASKTHVGMVCGGGGY